MRAFDRSSFCPSIIRLLTAGMLVAELAGCGGSGSQPPTPPPTKGVAIMAPADGTQTGVLPVAATVHLSGGATAKDVAIQIGGVDVSTSFTTNSSGDLVAQLSSTQVFVGENRFTATITGSSGASAKAKFTYDPSLAPGASPITYSAPLPDVIPIRTRVQYNGNWGIQVGTQSYPAPPLASPNGFQVLKLNRQTLAMVSNLSFNLSGADNGKGATIDFINDITPSTANTAACGYAGCLLVVQSLNSIGNNPCDPTHTQTSCTAYANAFAAIGATQTILWVPLNDSDVGYSFIGNVGQDGLHAGSQNERITCVSTNCGTFPPPDKGPVNNPGIAPNSQGYDKMPTLNQTGTTGCTQTTATPQMPQITYCTNGSIGGSLVLGAGNTYTFSYSEPSVSYSLTAAQDNPNNRLFTLSTATGYTGVQLESAPLPANADGTPPGGFHLVVLDATTLQVIANNTYTVNLFSCPRVANQNYCKGPDGKSNIYELDQLYQDILSMNSRRYLFFLHSIGNLNHSFPQVYASYPITNIYTQDMWDRVAQGVLDIGGTWITFDSLNNPALIYDSWDQYTPNTVPQDDYSLVGQWWINPSGVPNPYAAEESTQISRQTIGSATPPPSNMFGVLNKERDGYFRVTHESLTPLSAQQSLDFASAALMPQTAWPISTASTGGTLAAYTWISHQLLTCITGCGDIHAAYSNLNVSPNSWQALLSQLQPTTDGGDGFSQSDFEQVRGQLSLEFQYLSALRGYQGNLQGLLQAQQANLSILLQQTVDNIAGVMPVNVVQPSRSFGISNWRSDVMDALNVIGALSSLAGQDEVEEGANIVAAIAGFTIDASARHTVDAKGRTLDELTHTLYGASQIAGEKTQQFANILTTNGADFARISNDWGRLQKLGIPLVQNQFAWSDTATGLLLNAFDTSTSRALYRSIMPAGFYLNQYRWAAPGLHDSKLYPSLLPQSYSNCKYHEYLDYMTAQNGSNIPSPDFNSFAFWVGAPLDGLGVSPSDAKNTGAYNTWWDVWVLNDQNQGAIDCPTGEDAISPGFYSQSGIFNRLDPSNPSSLGMYKPWLFQRAGFPITQDNNSTASANFWVDQQQAPIRYLDNGLNYDPANY